MIRILFLLLTPAVTMDEDIFGEDYFPADPDEEEMFGEEPLTVEEVEMDLTEKPSQEPVQIENTTEEEVREEPRVIIAPDVEPLRLPPDGGESFMSIASATAHDSARLYLRTRSRQLNDLAEGGTKTFLEKPLEELHAMSLELTARRNAELTAWMAVKMKDTGETIQFIDKYKPKSFVDLLSDDTVNKQALTWLGEWKRNIMTPNSGSTISPVTDNGNNPIMGNKKILLVGGPPGVGKTALIDVCCRHFKFQIVESSASEDRGRAAMQKLITDVCSSRSVLDASKPQILVIEEIDSDECCAADVLADIMRKHPETIKRPVICVCTDVYTKNLKFLRECSTVIQMSPPRALRLGEKVKNICQTEGIRIESLAIDRLVLLCERDIRSVLNQLQTLVYRLGRDELIKVSDVLKYVGNSSEGRSMDAAVKDNQKSELELMQLIFEPKRSRTKEYSELINKALANSKSLAVGDLFAHCYVTVPFTDFNMQHCQSLSELMSLTDVGILNRTITLPLRYASFFCASVGRPRIDIGAARRLFAARNAKRNDRESITSGLIKSTLHSVRGSKCMMLSRSAWTLYLTRLLLVILSPEHNPVWTKKTAKNVHPDIERIAKIYADFGIELVEDNNTNGEGTLQVTSFGRPQVYFLNPNLRSLSELEDDVMASAIPPFPIGSPMGDLLRAQVKLFVTKALSGHTESVELVAKGKRSLAPSVEADNEMELKKLKSAAAMSLSSWRLKAPEGSKQSGKELVVKKHQFEFRFNEGHTNAVKRVLHLNDFLPKRVR
jgi:DNA polymerase III delta prime subunit